MHRYLLIVTWTLLSSCLASPDVSIETKFKIKRNALRLHRAGTILNSMIIDHSGAVEKS